MFTGTTVLNPYRPMFMSPCLLSVTGPSETPTTSTPTHTDKHVHTAPEPARTARRRSDTLEPFQRDGGKWSQRSSNSTPPVYSVRHSVGTYCGPDHNHTRLRPSTLPHCPTFRVPSPLGSCPGRPPTDSAPGGPSSPVYGTGGPTVPFRRPSPNRDSPSGSRDPL